MCMHMCMHMCNHVHVHHFPGTQTSARLPPAAMPAPPSRLAAFPAPPPARPRTTALSSSLLSSTSQCISHSLCALPSRRKASQCGLFTRLPAVKRRRSRPSRMEGLGRCCPLGGRRSTDGSGTSGSRRSTAVCSPGGISSTSSTTCSHRAPSRDAACHEASPRPAAPPPAAKSRTSGRAAAYSQPEAVKRRVAVRPAMEQAAGGSASDRRPPRS